MVTIVSETKCKTYGVNYKWTQIVSLQIKSQKYRNIAMWFFWELSLKNILELYEVYSVLFVSASIFWPPAIFDRNLWVVIRCSLCACVSVCLCICVRNGMRGPESIRRIFFIFCMKPTYDDTTKLSLICSLNTEQHVLCRIYRQDLFIFTVHVTHT